MECSTRQAHSGFAEMQCIGQLEASEQYKQVSLQKFK